MRHPITGLKFFFDVTLDRSCVIQTMPDTDSGMMADSIPV
jgi:hypothetical protein